MPIDVIAALVLVLFILVCLRFWTRQFKLTPLILIGKTPLGDTHYLTEPDENGTIRRVDQYGNTIECFFKDSRTVEEALVYDHIAARVVES